MATHQSIIPPPGPVDINGPNAAANWAMFYQKFELYLTATQQTTASEAVQVALLLSFVGEEALRTYNTFKFSGEEGNDRNKFKDVVKEFQRYCSPRKNTTYERFKFSQRVWEDGEKFEQFLTSLKILVRNCEFENQEDSMIRDRIIQGCSDRGLQEALLRLEDTSLEAVAQHCRTVELSKQQSQQISEALGTSSVNHPTSVDALQRKGGLRQQVYKQNWPNQQKQQGKSIAENRSVSEVFKCGRCQLMHKRRECPAWGKKCNKCGQLNHFAVACKVRQVRSMQLKNESDDDDIFVLHSIITVGVDSMFTSTVKACQQGEKQGHAPGDRSKTEWREQVMIEDKPLVMKIDTGSEVNVIPLDMFKKIDRQLKVRDTRVVLESYGGAQIKPAGVVNLHCLVGEKEAYLDFYIVNVKSTPLLSLSGSVKLGFVPAVHSMRTRQEAKEEFVSVNRDVFTGLGAFPKEHTIKIDANTPRFQHAPRRVAKSRLGPLRKELERLKEAGVIVRVKEPDPEGCISNIVIVDKPNGNVRICLDPIELNKVIFRKRYLIRKLQDIQDNLNKKKYYTVLDFKEGFSQLKLTQESRKYVMFSTPYGVFAYTRMPYGLAPAPEEFQEEVDESFGAIPNCVAYIDDVICFGETEAEHDKAVQAVVEKARVLGVKFNPDKVQYKLSEVRYLGHIFSERGMEIDPERIRALMELKAPNSVKELQRILGMLNYVRPFIPNMSDIEKPLQELRKQDSMWQWLPCHEAALNELKNMVCQAPCLRSFDPALPITLQCDASQSGLGACLLQEGQPVAFASRKMTESESNWAQIEKELLSILFGVTRFHDWIFGYHINILTDHKPLVPLMSKPIGKIGSTRLKRLRLKLLPYELSVTYLPGKDMHIGDLLSRSYVNDSVKDDPEMLNMVHSVSAHLAVTPLRRAQLVRETNRDPELILLKKYNFDGWPEHKKQANPQVHKYWQIRHEICVEEDLVFYQDRVIIPEILRQEILGLVHEGHSGVERCLARAGSIMYWPGWAKEMEQFVKQCKVCEKHAPKNKKEEYQSRDIPKLPYERVSADILEFGGTNYLVLTDAYSKWVDIVPIKDKTAQQVIEACRTVFAIHGDPQVLESDNVPFNSREFSCFARNRFHCNFSSPKYAQSNGLAEKGIHIAKQLLLKCNETNTDYRDALRAYRNMPIPGLGASPSQLLLSRSVRTACPISVKQLKPKVQDGVYKWLCDREIAKKEYYNKTTGRKEVEFHPGQNVVERTSKDKYWKTGKVIGRHQAPRSYWILNHMGNMVRRTTRDIKASLNSYSPKENYIQLERYRASQADHQFPENSAANHSPKSRNQESSSPDWQTSENSVTNSDSVWPEGSSFKGFSPLQAEVSDRHNVVDISPDDVLHIDIGQTSGGNKRISKKKLVCAECQPKQKTGK